MLILVMHYTIMTLMHRIHLKQNTKKYQNAYYEAVELMINNSSHKKIIIQYFNQVNELAGMYTLDEFGNISLQNLLNVNKEIFRDENTCKAILGKKPAELDDTYLGPNKRKKME